MNTDIKAIGWVGVGKMGEPICRNLLKAGFELHVFDIDPARVRSLAQEGAHPASTLAILAHNASVVLSMVPDDRALEAIALGADGLLAKLPEGSIYVDLSTVSPEASQKVADKAAERGIAYICAPVSGSTVLAQSGNLTLLASGPADSYSRLQAIFSPIAATRHYVGDDQQARYLKLAINHLVGSTAALMAEALALGRKGGLDWSMMLDVMGSSVIASPLVKYKLDLLKQREFAPAFSASQMLKDMTLVAEAGKSTGTSMPIAERVVQYFSDYAAHKPHADFFGLVEEVEANSGLKPL